MNELETLPAYEARRFYREIARMTEKFFEDPENQKRFKEWQKQKKKRGEKE